MTSHYRLFTFILLWLSTMLSQANTTSISPPDYSSERQLYRQALTQLEKGNRTGFKQLQAQLNQYPLVGYLRYQDLRSRLPRVSTEEIQQFVADYQTLPVTPLLEGQWLLNLGRQRRWKTLVTHYHGHTSVRLQCYYLRGLYATGRKREALEPVPALWAVGHSQPEACDPLFDTWIATEQLTDELAWSRLEMALQANQTQLARYVMRFFTPATERLATAYYQAHTQPSSISSGRLLRQGKRGRAIYFHGLLRMTNTDPDRAETLYEANAKKLNLDAADQLQFNDAIALVRVRDGQFPDISTVSVSAGASLKLAEAAIMQTRWTEAYHWIERLPETERSKPAWQYWLARALEQTQQHSGRARRAFFALAGQRNYYGFLAAMRLGLEPSLNNEQHQAQADTLATLQRRDDVQRALELYRVEDELNARREWYQLTQTLSDNERQQAAHLAEQTGWTFQMISTANAAQLHDSLNLRFPAPYTREFKSLAGQTSLPVSLLLSVARQESAFDPRARSHANARGLMQLLPSTAKIVARKAQLKAPQLADLYVPETNITLGSHHLARLAERYQGSRPLMAAAYNAGEHRVDRWIKSASGTPMDVWVERIPFRETRNYVKNIVAFSHVYGRMLGESHPVLESFELRIP